MIFDEIKTEHDVERLKKRIVKDDALFSRIENIRKKMRETESKADGKESLVFAEKSDAHKMPTNAEMMILYREMVLSGKQDENIETENLLRKIKTRSNSGVAVVSLLTKPYPCPGRCTYCPDADNMPKSYLEKEPAAARALAHDFDPYKQVQSRLRALQSNGHPIDKIEMIVIGGTWSFYHPVYQEEFIKECFRACNNFNTKIVIQKEKNNLKELQEINETAKCRIIGLSIETRPDYITSHELERLRILGVTKVEIGVQHLDNNILKLVKRDMTREAIAESTEKLRNAGFKVVYHMMPNLPGSDIQKDIEMFKELFSGKQFQPDMLKIYPCMVLDGTELYETWKKGDFRVYTNKELMEVLSAVKKDIPPYVRLIRVIRDIPAEYIKAGSIVSNMRQWLKDDMKNNNWQCRCVRCREVRNEKISLNDFKLVRREYETETGKEIFLSYEHKDTEKLAAFLRLRLPAHALSPQDRSLRRSVAERNDEKGAVLEDVSKRSDLEEQFRTVEKTQSGSLSVLRESALVRELHTYGQLIPVSEEGVQSQHVGLGKRLMQEAELIASEAGYKKVAVISGVGVRDYYRKKCGYELEDTYMVKYL